ncbi:MAG: ABC transporter ATP-binding protein [Gemmatimonadota bacterium]
MRSKKADLIIVAVTTALILRAMLEVPEWAAKLVNDIAGSGQTGVGLAGHLASGLLLTSGICALTFIRDYRAMVSVTAFVASVREKVIAHLMSRQRTPGSETRRGTQLSTSGTDMAVLQQSLLRGIAIGVPGALTAIALAAAMFATSAWLAAVVVCLAIPLLFAVGQPARRLHHNALVTQNTSAELLAELDEALDGLRDARVYGEEGRVTTRLMALSERVRDSSVREERLQAWHPAFVTLVGVAAIAILVSVAAGANAAGALTTEATVKFFVLLGLAVSPLQEGARAAGALARGLAIIDRVSDLLDAPIERERPPRPARVPARCNILLDDVTLHYPSFTLGPLSFGIEDESCVAIVGSSGAGKSTLLDLMMGLAEPASGVLAIGGMDLRLLDIKALRARMALVAQEPYLIRGTIEDNIRFGNPQATEDDVQRIAAACYVDEFTDRFPLGLKSPVYPRGTNLSAGQRQRVAVARALLRSPRILLLDEPTSSLDAESERMIAATIRRFRPGRTIVIVTHSAQLLEIADRVIVLERGGVAAASSPGRFVRRAMASNDRHNVAHL